MGARFSIKHQGYSGCNENTDKDPCGGYTFQFPVMIQYALIDRKVGPYVQAGLAFGSTYAFYGPGGAVKMKSAFDYKVGVGYRLGSGSFATLRGPSRLSVDLYANLDFGQFDHIKATTGIRSIDADVADGRGAMHYMLDIGLALHFTL